MSQESVEVIVFTVQAMLNLYNAYLVKEQHSTVQDVTVDLESSEKKVSEVL